MRITLQFQYICHSRALYDFGSQEQLPWLDVLLIKVNKAYIVDVDAIIVTAVMSSVML